MRTFSLVAGICLWMASSAAAAAPLYQATLLPGLPEANGYAEAFAINNQGQIVGQSRGFEPFLGEVMQRAVVWENGHVVDLGIYKTDGVVVIGEGSAFSINDQGEILGVAGVPAYWGPDRQLQSTLILNPTQATISDSPGRLTTWDRSSAFRPSTTSSATR